MADSGHYSIDSTTVRAHVSAAGGKGGTYRRALGRSRGGFTSKLHCLADLGRPVAFHLTGGEAADCKAYDALIDRNGFERPTSRAPGFPAILEVILGFRETARW
jgi:hypothetical protein